MVVHDLQCTLPPTRHHPEYPINSVDPPLREGYCKGEPDVCPSIFLPLSTIWRELNRTFPTSMSSYVLNIGAGSGKYADPVFPLLRACPDLRGIVIEASAFQFSHLKRNMAQFRRIKPVRALITQRNLLRVTHDPNPNDSANPIDVLKLDIDGCECHLLQDLLGHQYYRAKVIQIELNHFITPPISYKELCSPDDSRSARAGNWSVNYDVYGCSMQAAWDIVYAHGYRMLQLDWPDAVFIRGDYQDAFPCFPFRGGYGQFLHAFWTGYAHARKYYKRFSAFQTMPRIVMDFPALAQHAASSASNSFDFMQLIIDTYKHSWTKPNVSIEMAVVTSTGRYRTMVSKLPGKPLQVIKSTAPTFGFL